MIKFNHEAHTPHEVLGFPSPEALVTQLREGKLHEDLMFATALINILDNSPKAIPYILMGIYPDQDLPRASKLVELLVRVITNEESRLAIIVAGTL